MQQAALVQVRNGILKTLGPFVNLALNRRLLILKFANPLQVFVEVRLCRHAASLWSVVRLIIHRIILSAKRRVILGRGYQNTRAILARN